MIKIFVRNSDLIVEDEIKQIFEWNHRAFFNLSLGGEVNEEKSYYLYSEKNQFYDLINEIVSYLQEAKINFTTDKKVEELIFKNQNQKYEFDKAKENINKKITVQNSVSFKRELKPYQKKGVEHFLKIGHGANFSVPGSGKTTMVYAYFDLLKRRAIVDKIFVVGPYSCFSPWEEESEKCFEHKLNSVRLIGAKREYYYFQSMEFDLFLCHYQTVANDKNEIIEFCNKYKVLLVIDESHYIKRFEGGVWAEALLAIAPHAKCRVILSGTPMPNGYIDLWSQITFLWPGKQLLGERNLYKNRCENVTQQEEIKEEIRPFFYRVKKSDLKLPKPKTIKSYYNLRPIQAQIYHALSVRFLTEMDLQPNDRRKLKLWRKAKMVRLLQAASNPTLLCQYSQEFDIPPLSSDGTSLIELIEKYPKYEIPIKFDVAFDLSKKLLSEGKKVILWTTFIHNIDMLREKLKDTKYFIIHGAIPRDDNENESFNREKEIREFKISNEPCLLIANPAACAESISLHKVCHDAIYLDRTFNCGQFIQSLDRIHRIGLEKNEIVNYHILIAKNTIDETIDDRLEAKYQTMIHVLEDDIPIGALDIEGPELEDESEETADFDDTIKDIRKFLKDKKL